MKMIECGRHGQSPAYIVCEHIMNGAKAAMLETATEEKFGEALCYICLEESTKRELTAEEASVICAGCLFETQGIKP